MRKNKPFTSIQGTIGESLNFNLIISSYFIKKTLLFITCDNVTFIIIYSFILDLSKRTILNINYSNKNKIKKYMVKLKSFVFPTAILQA